MKKLTKEEELIQRLDNVLLDNTTNTGRIFNNEEDIRTLQEMKIVGSNSIIVTDNRNLGTGEIRIESADDWRVDELVEKVEKLERTNKILAKFIYDEQKNQSKSQPRPKTQFNSKAFIK